MEKIENQTPEQKAEVEAEAARVAALTPEEKAAEEAEAERVANLSEEEKKAEEAGGETPEAKAAREKEERSIDRMQARIDEITAEKAALARKLEEIEKKITPKEEKPKYTENDLYAILADPEQAQYHPFAVKELIRMGISDYDKQSQQRNGATAAVRASAEKALDEFPELEDPKSELFARATKIFDEHGLKDNPNGTYLAAKMAAAELGADKGETKEQLEKKLARLNKKSSLAGGGVKTPANPNAAMNKLKKEALAAGFGSGKWNEWQKAIAFKKK